MDNILEESLRCIVLTFGKGASLQTHGLPPILQEDRIHIWSAAYNDLDRHFGILAGVISSEEQRTASSLRNSADTRNYIIRHGVLRIILGNYTNEEPEKISLFTRKNGKPQLDPHGSNSDISFNLSHTKEMVLIGISHKHQIGVDIVKLDPFFQYHDIAEYILTPPEKEVIQRVEHALRYQVFFRIWALKEAILKATGGTLAMMKNTDISACIEDVFSSSDSSVKYHDTCPPFLLWEYNIRPGHYGAIAAESENPV